MREEIIPRSWSLAGTHIVSSLVDIDAIAFTDHVVNTPSQHEASRYAYRMKVEP